MILAGKVNLTFAHDPAEYDGVGRSQRSKFAGALAVSGPTPGAIRVACARPAWRAPNEGLQPDGQATWRWWAGCWNDWYLEPGRFVQ
jgi:hypothetical protein